MFRQRNELHIEKVETWKKQFSNLSAREFSLLLIKAIQAIRAKSLGTLSGVTVAAVVGRAHFEGKEKFPVLEMINGDANELDFTQFLNQLDATSAEVSQKALEEFLIDLLDVFGKITADILTKYLHQELMLVKPDVPSKEETLQKAAPLKLAKTRDQK